MNVESEINTLPTTQESGYEIPGGSSEEEEIVFHAQDQVERCLDEYPKGLELPTNKEKHFQYVKNWKKVEKLAEEEDDSAMVPKDCYSFISLHGPTEPIFWVGVAVFLFQMLFLFLALLSIALPVWNTGKIDDNPSDTRLANLFATEVGPILRATQFASLITSIIFVDSSVSDIVTAINTMPNYKIATKDDRVYSMALSCILRFIQGLFAVIVSFVLVFNSNNVIEVILNFTALNFISTLDDILFDFSRTGKYGPYLEKEVKRIEKTKIPVCMFRTFKVRRLVVTFLPLIFLLLGSGIALAVVQDSDMHWETKVFRVQFEDPNLQEFNGCYHNDVARKDRKSKRDFYVLDGNATKNAEFGFCLEKQQWFLYEVEDNTTPKFNCTEFLSNDEIDEDKVVIMSDATTTFDIETVFLDDWFSGDGTPTDLFFWEEVENVANLKCDAFIGNGVCETELNRPTYDYDGGDCCATTCTQSNCGVEALIGAFDSNNDTVGDGYMYCEDSAMYPLTIELGNFTSSRELYKNKVLPLSGTEQTYIEEYYPEFYEETPTEVLLTLYCEGTKTLKLYVDDSMQGKRQTVKVPDEADCVIRFENRTSFGDPNFLDNPIWYIDYSVYMVGKENITANGPPPIFSNNTQFLGSKNFERPPNCAFDNLSEEFQTKNTVKRKAIQWLLENTEAKNGKCQDNYEELFGLANLNFAAQSSSPKLEGGLWIQKGPVCDWLHVACVGTFGNTTLDLLELDISSTQLSGSIPTNIGSLGNLVKYDASNNALKGPIPTEIGNLTSLSLLNMGQNGLNGTIPTEIGLLTSLEFLNLTSNHFTGSIPTEIGLLSSLKRLYLSETDITGSIPSEVGNLKSLQELVIASNYNMIGSIPREIESLTDLEHLDLSGIGLSGTIPSVIGKLNSMVRLGIANNDLTGFVPSELGLVTNLSELMIDNTAFSGIADEIGNISNLTIYMDDAGFSKDSVSPNVTKQIADECNLCPFGYSRSDTIDCYIVVIEWELHNRRANGEVCTRLENNCLDCKTFADVLIDPLQLP